MTTLVKACCNSQFPTHVRNPTGIIHYSSAPTPRRFTLFLPTTCIFVHNISIVTQTQSVGHFLSLFVCGIELWFVVLQTSTCMTWLKIQICEVELFWLALFWLWCILWMNWVANFGETRSVLGKSSKGRVEFLSTKKLMKGYSVMSCEINYFYYTCLSFTGQNNQDTYNCVSCLIPLSGPIKW